VNVVEHATSGGKPGEVKGLLFVLLTLTFLCVSDMVTFTWPAIERIWYVVLVAGLLLILFLGRRMFIGSPLRGYMLCWAGWGGLIVIAALVHAVALSMLPGNAVINAEGMHAGRALLRVAGFSFFYLCLPLLMLLQYTLLKGLPLLTVTRWVCGAATLSALALMYQFAVDPHFFHLTSNYFHRFKYDGLSNGPNTFAIVAFFSVTLFLIGAVLETRRSVKILYVAGVLLTFAAAIIAGSRTANVGIMIQITLALSCWAYIARSKRVLISIPIIVLLLFSGVTLVSDLGVRAGKLHSAETLSSRLVTLIQGISHQSLSDSLLNSGPGNDSEIARALVSRNPWSGWGPGGYNREYSNQWFAENGEVKSVKDSIFSHYLMIACDFGLPMMLFNLALIAFPVLLGVHTLRNLSDEGMRLPVAIMTAGNAVFVLMLIASTPSYYMDVLWMWSASMALQLVLAERHSELPGRKANKVSWFSMLPVGLLVLSVSLGSYITAFGVDGYAQRLSHPYWQTEQAGSSPDE